jgi:hypothetical protein
MRRRAVRVGALSFRTYAGRSLIPNPSPEGEGSPLSLWEG